MSIYAPITPEVIAFLRPWVEHGVCEIGAGDGKWLEALEAANIKNIGYDVEPKGPAVVKGNHVKASEICSDMAMLAVWPPDGDEIQKWIGAWRGDTIIICGQFFRFDVGDTLKGFLARDFKTVTGGLKGDSLLAVYTRV